MKCGEVIEYLEQLSPKKYASNWDNVGLLVGRRDKEIKKLMVSLDASGKVVRLAVENNVDMLVTHHPIIFSSIKKVNEDDFVSEKVLTLAEHGISYYAMHTNFDTVGGMGELAAGPEYLNLTDTEPLVFESDDIEGMGRGGRLPKPMTAKEVSEYVKERFGIPFVMLYQDESIADKVFDRIAVLPGSGKSELDTVRRLGYELYLTGDYGHHPGLDAIDMDLTVIDATHYGLEHIFTPYITGYLKEQCSGVEILPIDTGCPVAVV